MNRSRSIDAVDAALESLRGDDRLELPDPRVERRLVRWADELVEGRTPGRSTTRSVARVAALAATFAVLLGGSLWATVGIEGLRRWWYSIHVDGEHVAGEVEGSGGRAFEFTTPDGYAVHVRIERSPAPGPERTRVAVRETGPDELSEEVWELGDAEALPIDRHPLELVEDARPLHRWIAGTGAEHELYLIDDPERPGEAGDWLVVRDRDAPADRAVRRIQVLARSIGPRGRVDVVERADGTLAVELADGRGWACALELDHASERRAGPTEMTTPSGRVRVELGDD